MIKPYNQSSHNRNFMKRVFDLIMVFVVSLIAAPICVVVALVVFVNMGSPVLFRQTRLGLNAKPFRLIKFRTMLPVDKERGRVDDAERLTKVGRILRAMSLDELPTLWNVLRGDMSIVGPRPLPDYYLNRYSPIEMRRHEVRPGITGWAQINGRNTLSWDEKFACDVWYVDHCRMSIDLWILVRTIVTVLSGKGISAEGNATAPEFLGSTVSVDRGGS